MTKKRFFTSDQHFGHANILKYEAQNRVNQFGNKFATVEEMDEHLISQWNDVISPEDEVFALGDFSFKPYYMKEYLPKLNGTKFLIVGNHDPFFKPLTQGGKNERQEAKEKAQAMGWSDIYLSSQIEIDGFGKVLMNHFPYFPKDTSGLEEYELRYPDLRPDRNGDQVLLLHGHVHGLWKTKSEPHSHDKSLLMINVGVDVWGMRPVALEEIAELARNKL